MMKKAIHIGGEREKRERGGGERKREGMNERNRTEINEERKKEEETWVERERRRVWQWTAEH